MYHPHHYQQTKQQQQQQQPPPPPPPPSSKQQPNLPSQQWSNRYQPAPPAWSGHNYHHAQGSSGPSAYHPPPQSYHYHQHTHHQSSRIHPSGPHPHHHYQTSSPAGPGSTNQPMQHMQMRAPLVSPSTPAATNTTSPPMTSSSHHLNLPPPLPASAKASAKEIDVAVNATVASMSTEGMMTTKPPRPYTEYTMFYQLEREFIIHRILATDEERNGTANNNNHGSPGSVDSNGNQVALFENDPLMPARYRSLPLRADWYISGKTKKPSKRKHRKSHGKIGFLELTRMIAARWAKVDDETKKYCKMMAAMELVKYKEDMECYNEYKDRLSAMGEIPEDMKERMLKKQKQQERKEAVRFKEAIGTGAAPQSTLSIKADAVGSGSAMPIMSNGSIKLEPFDHGSPIERITDMDEFISSLIDSPNRPSTAKVITPERRSNRSHNGNPFRGRPALVSSSAAVTGTPRSTLSKTFDEFLSPLGNGDVNLDGIKMTFSGFDETEMVREFSDQIHRSTSKTSTPKGTMRKMAETTPSSPGDKKLDPSFDYWDHLVGPTSP